MWNKLNIKYLILMTARAGLKFIISFSAELNGTERPEWRGDKRCIMPNSFVTVIFIMYFTFVDDYPDIASTGAYYHIL